jgi:quercetin 2,3-dioxygenase
MNTPDPFLFCVYHKDFYPAGDANMAPPRGRANGADFDPTVPWRMYHGESVPGFPQHPHRGFETITATMEGLIDHSDSLGNAGRYGHGDLQWMTAGKGVVHGEMFPLVHADKPNTCRFFQIWINLPSKNKMVDPNFKMHWAEQTRKWRSKDALANVTVWAGTFGGLTGLPPPQNSWASDPANEVAVWHIVLQPKGSIELPAASGSTINRCVYFIEGSSLEVGGQVVSGHAILKLDVGQKTTISNPSLDGSVTELLLLQGKPISEPVAQHGPFVMNTQAEIRQAFKDYQATEFGGWPWPQDAMTFPRDKGRFALLDGVEEVPPTSTSSNDNASNAVDL